mgnify:CR=1 FL=1
MKKVRAAIVGYGNIGHYVLEALQAAPDFEIAGVVRRAGAENKPEEFGKLCSSKGHKRVGGCRRSYSFARPPAALRNMQKNIWQWGLIR